MAILAIKLMLSQLTHRQGEPASTQPILTVKFHAFYSRHNGLICIHEVAILLAEGARGGLAWLHPAPQAIETEQLIVAIAALKRSFVFVDVAEADAALQDVLQLRREAVLRQFSIHILLLGCSCCHLFWLSLFF